ncbi:MULTISPECIES: hypothetical protein [Klebsiella/Raoultella group]|jgi:hypothetical protein|uniref:hypothetical protein n=1 Tax=Klebsiella/Raoultella group TaxID=2890311 RepID=UPI0006688B55|nr:MULTISPECIES: hypothetical protein [Klebsiella/Raoultella group]HCT4439810.1 hypothetical protein [Klebsiella aerogenes]MCW9502237.1 hypothetical protein [Klebsiella oxytoca]MDL4403469.1 hypothetical protein [Klebsiella michiganensis]MDL4534648.1 hypothetical protein [Klebsiella michiganensis]MDU4362892.1 hypothetical protein [Klebsiella oxytoca]
MMKTEPAEENIAEITDKRLTIGMDEPPVLRVLDALCYNEKRRAMNYPNSEMVNIGWFQRKMASFINVHSDHFNNRINLQEARYLSGFFLPGSKLLCTPF